MTVIKWISKRVKTDEVQSILNTYKYYMYGDTIKIIKVGNGGEVLLTFMLSQSFDSEEELDRVLEEKQ